MLQLPKMDLFLTENRGWGVKAAAPIPRGAFIVEYAGALQHCELFLQQNTRAQDDGPFPGLMMNSVVVGCHLSKPACILSQATLLDFVELGCGCIWMWQCKGAPLR